jgi:RNA polymerase sigma-70 factor (ECF subfamily)
MTETLPTQLLIERIQNQDDRQARELLFARYHHRVLHAVRCGLSPGLRQNLQSMDVLQEVMLEAAKKLNEFADRGDRAFMKYLNAVIRSKIRDQARFFNAEGRNRDRETPIDEADSTSGNLQLGDSNAKTPSQIFGLLEDELMLNDALCKLGDENEEYRELIVARKLLELSYDEMAREHVGEASSEAIRKKCARALLRLIEIVREMDSDG